MTYTYSVTIDSVNGLPVATEDVQLALIRSGQEGPDIDVWQTEENYFTIEAEEEIDLDIFKAALERLDGVASCKASVELIT